MRTKRGLIAVKAMRAFSPWYGMGAFPGARAPGNRYYGPLDLGLWPLDLGLWPLDLGLWTLDLGPWTLDFPRNLRLARAKMRDA